MQLGFFTNAQSNYYTAPAQVNNAGIIFGHTHVIIKPITALNQTKPANPIGFTFFKGIPVGTYQLFSINTMLNHQPALTLVAQHGSMDDSIYFMAM